MSSQDPPEGGATAVTPPETTESGATPPRRRTWPLIVAGLLAGALVTFGILALLLNIFQHKQEATQPYFQVVDITDDTEDPAEWGKNFPLQYEGWKNTVNEPEGSTVPNEDPAPGDPRNTKTISKLKEDPRLVTMWQGYAFAVEYNEPRGHAWMLDDQRYVKRVTEFKQPGTCLNCHASTYVLMKNLGDGDIFAGFDKMNAMTYQEATSKVTHPVGCIDCHEPKTMQLRVTRPGFINGIKEYKAGQGIKNYDVNKDATAQEMRAYVCAQCHVEYYFKGPEKTLTFPWDKGLTVDDALAYYNEVGWTDFTHALTGANVVKAQHPDFETWSQSVHARAGVTCADCHMPYQRTGAQKISNHDIRSPMESDETINASCLTCHHSTEAEMKGRVDQIQTRYYQAYNVSFQALDDLIKDLEQAQKDGVAEDRLTAARAFQRKAQFYLDYVVSENSEGFHAPGYSLRVLNDVTDAAHKGQLALVGKEVPKDVPGPYPKVNPNAPKK